jgi:hypothetical protein
MPKRRSARPLLIALLTTIFLLAGQLPAAASNQSGSDAAFYPLAICRDGISFLFAADYYPAGPDNPADHRAPDRIQSVQPATQVPPADANGRITPPVDTLVLDTTITVPHAPQLIDLATFDTPPLFPTYPPHVTLSWPYPQPVGLQYVHYAGGPYTLRWDRKPKARPQSVVLSFDRYDTTTYSAEIVADVGQLPPVQGLASAMTAAARPGTHV